MKTLKKIPAIMSVSMNGFNGGRNYQKIFANRLEIDATNRCNLSCKGCSRLSPICQTHQFDVKLFKESLNKLAQVYHANVVRILGGEPLLSPELREIIEAVRKSKISNKIELASNGFLLSEEHQDILNQIDLLEISLHTQTLNLGKVKQLTLGRCDLRILAYERFRIPYSETGTNDSDLVQDIYDTCLAAHRVRCWYLTDNIFYKCPQSHCLKACFSGLAHDGVDILCSRNLLLDLLHYLTSKTPLNACKYCLGSVGKRFEQEQVSRDKWRSYQNYPSEELIDYEILEKYKKNDYREINPLINYKKSELITKIKA